MTAGRDAVGALIGLGSADQVAAAVRRLPDAAVRGLASCWPAWVHQGQEVPEDGDWRVWVMLGGRGFGKTRAGAEWVTAYAWAHPEARIALVAATPAEARRVMIEGKSGLVAVARRRGGGALWQPSRGLFTFANGARAQVFSGANPDTLRGPEHDLAWCDELAKWPRAQDCWSNLQLGLRVGARPRALVTTTPKSVAALKEILAQEDARQGGGPASANPHLAEGHIEAMERRWGGTRLGRQELGGELIEEVEDALWTRETIEKSRCAAPAACAMRRVVVGVDPPAGTAGDACGIVVCGLGEDGVGYVLGDHSASGLSPEGWARKVAAAAAAHGARRVIAEANNGGEMVRSVLKAADEGLAVKLVHAAEGKIARAEPVSTLFENKRAKLAGAFPALEDELAGLSWSGRYEGPGRSPDRADAMVWALSELLLGPARAEPRVRAL